MAQKSVNGFTQRNDSIYVCESSDLGWGAGQQVVLVVMARKETTPDTELLLMSFTLEFLLSYVGHKFGGALRNLSIWCDSNQNKDLWGFIY